MRTPTGYHQFESLFLKLSISDEVAHACEHFQLMGIRGVKVGPVRDTGNPYQVRLTIDAGRGRCLYRYVSQQGAW